MCVLFFAGCAQKEPPAFLTTKQNQKTTIVEPQPKIKPIVLSDKNASDVVDRTKIPDKDLMNALEKSIAYYRKISPTTQFSFDTTTYSAHEMMMSLKLFQKIVEENAGSPKNFLQHLDDSFDVYESKNTKKSALITGYYAPVLSGSFVKTNEYTVPLYPMPQDLITARLKKFALAHSRHDIEGRLVGDEMIPYYTREQINAGALKEKPILYIHSKIDAFLLGVQGSGIIEVDGKKYYVGYAGKNGQPYTSIGKVIYNEKLMDPDKINMQSIKAFLEQNSSLQDYILNQNKSYVFFKFNKQPGVFGSLGVALTAKASVAMDNDLMPKGALCYIKTSVPKKIDGLFVVPRSEREPFEKFFVVQDTGGAITGGGRVDIYFGEGDEGLFYAGQTASRGEVYFLVAKKEALKEFETTGEDE